jgi:hypothetical protein
MTAPTKVTRDDIENRLRALQTGVTERVEATKGKIIAGAAAAGVVMLVIAFLLGKRKGKKKTTVVEIRRL